MNRQLLMTMLGMALLSIVAINLQRKQAASLTQEIYQAQLVEAASQEASFARAVSDYIQSNSVASGTILRPAEMVSAGDLAPGYPAANPFGQMPEAIVGAKKAVLVTYSGVPTATRMQVFNVNTSSTIDMEAMAEAIAANIAAMQAGLPQLAGGMLDAGNLVTPMSGQSVTASTYLPGVSLPAGPIFCDMLNILQVPTYNSNSSSYPPTTGD
jgi:hypothetical protein